VENTYFAIHDKVAGSSPGLEKSSPQARLYLWIQGIIERIYTMDLTGITVGKV
jgi:hypothetical protein